MRARNIKPALFKNEVLGTADPLLTLLFEGLWCEADRDGRLEDRPLRLKAEIFPYRHDANIDAMLDWLTAHGFIARYEAQNTKVIQVLKFSDHQRPHNNEVASVLPSMDAIKHTQGKKPARPRKKALRSDSLLSDSPSLIPDTGYLIPDTGLHVARAVQTQDEAQIRLHVDAIKAIYPKAARQDWITAEKLMRNIVSDGCSTWMQIEEGVGRYQRLCKATNRSAQNPGLFFAAVDRPWLQEWPIPANKAETLRDSNVDVSREWLRAAQ